MKVAFSEQYIREVRWRVAHARELKNEAWANDIIERLKGQMFNLSKIMHMLKRRFDPSFVGLCNLASPLGNRFAARQSKDYRWCGYAEAVGGARRARGALQQLLAGEFGQELTWREAAAVYRCWLFEGGERRENAAGATVRKGVSRERVEKVWAEGGRLSRLELLHCRVRYFTAGVAIGSRAFVEDVFKANRDRFGERRKTGARPMRYGDWKSMCSMRDLRVDVIQPPPG